MQYAWTGWRPFPWSPHGIRIAISWTSTLTTSARSIQHAIAGVFRREEGAEMKCLKCELPKSINDFPRDPSGRPGAYCNDCISQLQLESEIEEEVKSTKTFFVSQGETCPICLNKMPYGVVDPSHEMGHICAIICQGCNALLGKLRGNHELIDEAIAKLQRAKQYLLERDLYSREDHELKMYRNNKPYLTDET
jgi:hypothetical protein